MPTQTVWHVAGFALNSDTLIFSWLSMAAVFVLFRLAARRADVERPRGLQNVIELTFEFVGGFVSENVNEEQGKRLFRLLVSLLLYVLVANLVDLLPLPMFHTATADANVTMGLALLVFILIHAYGMKYRGVGGHLKSFVMPHPLFAPINLLEVVTTPLTLAMRLFGNIFAGDLLMGIASSIAPSAGAVTLGAGLLFLASVLVQLAVLGFNTFIAVVQAYIFMMLTLAYISQTMKPAGEH